MMSFSGYTLKSNSVSYSSIFSRCTKYKNEPFSGLRIILSGSVVLFNALYT